MAIPGNTREKIIAFHRRGFTLSDCELDHILGLSPQRTEARLDLLDLLARYGNEQFAGDGLGYQDIRAIIKSLKPRQSEVVYDLGSGYGRFIVYGAIVSGATFRGVEIVRERAVIAEQARKSLKLENADIIVGNAINVDLSDGDIFYLFNPFFTRTLRLISEKIRIRAMSQPVRIAALYHVAAFFRTQNWLRETTSDDGKDTLSGRFGISIFKATL